MSNLVLTRYKSDEAEAHVFTESTIAPATKVDWVDQAKSAVQADCVMLVSALPSGRVQVVQAEAINGSATRAYQRALVDVDFVTWQAILTNTPARLSDANNPGLRQQALTDFLGQHGWGDVAAVPAGSPIFEGFPGALVALRKVEEGAFTHRDTKALQGIARELVEQATAQRSVRMNGHCLETKSWAPRARCRFYIFDEQANVVFPKEHDDEDTRFLLAALHVDASHRLQRGQVEGARAHNRVHQPDHSGQLVGFRVTTHETFPALGDGKFVVYVMLPDVCDWQALTQDDVAADTELRRLVPALHYMQGHFNTGPRLDEIARSVHLSPFHFHRRFTDLMGLTPKRFMLDCQIDSAKRELARGERDLPTIAGDCGFAHQSHFTSRFKQTTGMTPTRWRRAVARAGNAS